MTLTIAAEPVPLRLDSGGTYRVGPTRVRLDTVIFAYNAGASAEQIVEEFPGLDLGDVHAVLAYYLHHRADVDAYLAAREEEGERLRRQLEAEGICPNDGPELKAKLQAIWNERIARP